MSINFAVIGSNFIVDSFLNAAIKLTDFNFYAIYSRQYETGKAKAKPYSDHENDVKVFTDLAEMLKDDNIDAVYIASPNSLHAPQAIQCLNAGKHVLGEKPSAANCKELDKIIAAAQQNKRCYMEALMSLHLPNYKVVKNNIDRIGTPRKYVGQYCQYSSRYSLMLSQQGEIPNTFLPEFANGALMDLGIYPLYPLIDCWGKPDSISAQGILLPTGVDGAGDLQLQYGKNADKLAHISFSKISNGENFAEFQGELGRLRIEFVSLMVKVELFLNDGRYEDLSVAQDSDPMIYEIEHFITLINNDQQQSDITDWALSKRVLTIIDQARLQIGVSYPIDQPMD
jgi:scyllo-inositol 2-dehydrogenase (NADP+)